MAIQKFKYKIFSAFWSPLSPPLCLVYVYYVYVCVCVCVLCIYQISPDSCKEKKPVIENTLFQQHKRTLYTWTSPDGQYQNQIYYIICSQRWRSLMQSTKIRQGAGCGSDHELPIAFSRLLYKWNVKVCILLGFNYFHLV